MEVQKLFTLVTLVILLVLVSLVSSRQEETMDDETKPEQSNEGTNQDGPAEEPKNVCKKEVCKERAKLIHRYLNKSASPCEDFYFYVCGKWINEHNTTRSYDSFQMLQQRYVGALRRILERLEPKYNPQEVTDKPVVLYNSCMASTEQDDNTAFLDIIGRSEFKEWPVMNESAEREEKFNNASKTLSKVGMSFILQNYVARNTVNRTNNVIKILPLGVSALPTNESIKGAVEFVKSSVTDTQLRYVIETLQDIESEWKRIMALPRKLMAVKTPLTIGSLEETFRNIPLYSLLREEFAAASVELNKNEPVEVFRLDLYYKIDQLMEVVNPVSLYNYVGLQFVLHWLYRSPSKVKSEVLKPEHCVGLVHTAMKEVVSYHYAKENFSTAAKEKVEEIFQKIKDAVEVVLTNADWMNEENRTHAKKKLQKMVAKIGYPNWVLNTTVLASLYDYVPILYSNISFLKKLEIIDKNNEKKTMQKLRQPYDKDKEWFFSHIIVNAFFNPAENEIVYPLGGLGSPFYELGLPWSVNLGGVGAVIGHEITHALSGRTSKFDENGIPLYMPESEKFQERAECFKFQYGNTTDRDAHILLNGTTTLNENIADNSGLQIAAMAYQKLVAGECNNMTTSLEGLEDMSGLKLLFVTNGMSWCNAISEVYLKYKIAKSSHSPNRYRVNLPMHNEQAFAAAFNCSSDSAMITNYNGQCSLWGPTV